MYETFSTNYEFVCADNLGTDNNDVALLYFTESIGSFAQITKSWYWDSPIKKWCLGVSIDASNGYVLIHE